MKIGIVVFASVSPSAAPMIFATQLLVNHLFIRFIRVIRGLIVFRRQ
jgi:hypothetical protein